MTLCFHKFFKAIIQVTILHSFQKLFTSEFSFLNKPCSVIFCDFCYNVETYMSINTRSMILIKTGLTAEGYSSFVLFIK